MVGLAISTLHRRMAGTISVRRRRFLKLLPTAVVFGSNHVEKTQEWGVRQQTFRQRPVSRWGGSVLESNPPEGISIGAH